MYGIDFLITRQAYPKASGALVLFLTPLGTDVYKRNTLFSIGLQVPLGRVLFPLYSNTEALLNRKYAGAVTRTCKQLLFSGFCDFQVYFSVKSKRNARRTIRTKRQFHQSSSSSSAPTLMFSLGWFFCSFFISTVICLEKYAVSHRLKILSGIKQKYNLYPNMSIMSLV